MDFSLNDDHLALRDAVQRFCEGDYPAQERGNRASATQTLQRRQALAELGVLGLPFAAEWGGSAQGAIEVMLVAQELGRALADWSFIGSTVMAGQVLSRLGTREQQQRWLPELARGDSTAAVALYEPGARYQWQAPMTTAVPLSGTTTGPQGYGWVLNGSKAMVLAGDGADVFLVLARIANQGEPNNNKANGAPPHDQLRVFAIDAGTPGLQVQGFDTLDNRRAAHLELNNVVVGADRLLQPDSGNTQGVPAALEAMLDAANAALCAEAVGAVTALLALTAEHLRTRKQFGAPLAKFQVLQHRVADMAMALEQLKSMACAAAMAVQADEPAQRRRLVSAAKVLTAQQGRAIGLAAIQLHGAMGMTDECRVGHYAKRLMVIGQVLGDAAWHLNALRALNPLTPLEHPQTQP